MRRAKAAVQNVTGENLLYKDPANDQEAMNSDEKEHWFKDLVNEYDGFFDIKTWAIRKRKDVKLEHGNKPLSTKNVYKKKVHAITKEP